MRSHTTGLKIELSRRTVLRELRKRVRFVPLISAGVMFFLSMILLGDLTGLVWHIRAFDWWIRLNPFVLGKTADWLAWGIAFLFSIYPIVIALARKMARTSILVASSILIPSLFLVAIYKIYFVGAAFLLGAGFLAVLILILKGKELLRLDRRSAATLVSLEVIVFLAVVAFGSVVALLLWKESFVFGLTSTFAANDVWLRMLQLDLAIFYLGRPILSALFIILAAISVVVLVVPSVDWTKRLWPARGLKPTRRNHRHHDPVQLFAKPAKLVPYLILVGSILLAIAITTYPYTVVGVRGVLGSDSWFYIKHLGNMKGLSHAVLWLQGDRGFFLVFLFLVKSLSGLDAEGVVRLMPTILSAFLALSSYALVSEGTQRRWLAAFAALLSVVSAQTALGMSAGIIANWFALSLANLTFAFILRSWRVRSRLVVLGAVATSILLLGFFVWLWVLVICELLLLLVISLVQFRNVDGRQWKNEAVLVSIALVGTLIGPVVLFFAARQVLGFSPIGLDPRFTFFLAWTKASAITHSHTMWEALSGLEQAFDFAGTRIDLPFLTLLSIFGLLDGKSRSSFFNRVMAAMIIVPAAIALITPDLLFTWRGPYVIPLYLTGAIGTETIVRRLNGQESSRKMWGRLAFAIALPIYVFLSQLGYSLRALELLILVAAAR